MPALSPALFLAAANSLASTEDYPSPRRFDGSDEARMASALFVNHVGYQSHLMSAAASLWPFRLTLSCEEMAERASQRGVLHTLKPEPGEIYLRWSRKREQFIGAGIVLSASDRMTEQGWGYLLRLCVGSARMVSPERSAYRHPKVQWVMMTEMLSIPRIGDRFVRWPDLDTRDTSRVEAPRGNTALPFRSTVSPWRKRRWTSGLVD